MSCNSESYLVKKNMINHYDYQNWFNKRPEFCSIAELDICGIFNNVESLLWNLIDECEISLLKENNESGWIVVELNLENINQLIKKCKDIIKALVEYDEMEKTQKDEILNIIKYYDEDVPEEFCYLLKALKRVKEFLIENEDCSFIVNLNY